MKNLTPELIEKAKTAKTAEELLALAKEHNVEMTEESAKAYFAQLNPKTGELSDDELDNVSGGGCYSDNRLVVTVGTQKDCFVCKTCGENRLAESSKTSWSDLIGYIHLCTPDAKVTTLNCCNECKYCTYEGGLWLCNNPANYK